jgi:hypothetical protein
MSQKSVIQSIINKFIFLSQLKVKIKKISLKKIIKKKIDLKKFD